MDELEFRRRTIAQPNELDKELQEFANSSADRQQFLNESKAFDKQLDNALEIPVPDNLAERIILNTSLKEKARTDELEQKDNVVSARSWFKFDRVHLALAASFVIAVSAFMFSEEQSINQTAGEHALAHVYHEIYALNKTQPISIQAVNEKLALLGGQISDLPGKVTYVTFCDFQGERGLHLVFESDFGPMTVFIVPSDNQIFEIGSDDFNDSRYAGHINRGKQADTVLIASLGSPVDMYNERISGAIRWL
ncbi:DUF3379 domain-containing protein [Pseudoalteromonas sp. Scap03]|jgi:hypothetical protein|uniref:DUF3379 family protein n=1 Tax=unclassified Pseudoalteromonas TaxID=194690 RepID=UPI00110A6DC5|nr:MULTISPECIES: DUF3379 family protein [unclassified Pseudoalteromonas]NWL15824.1 DUF3379 domain-containing protein [Pseudoalteromonas sp. Scap03]QLE80966.1 DUF3379 family protein [Pseudoalteromonas sp. Scap25]QLE88909.1 DUF3379 family protein [Pseudoalteromonas sp. Scap06]TMP71485.1 DUF3379 domain-containing protein [Pseudoalteromonas sp. S1609]